MIDVIIPAYNCSSTLKRTLFSLASQINLNFKVILIDDYSTEDILSIVDQFKNILTITYIRNEKNLGCGMSRQIGIDNATSEYITFLDSDDVFMPYTIEIFSQMVKSNPEKDMFHSYFYQQDIINGTPVYILHKDGFTWCHGKLYKLNFIKKYNIKNSPEVKYADDSFFNSMCTELASLGIIKFPMMTWINNLNSITRNKNGMYKKEKMIDFINAMTLSIHFILQYKKISEINHLSNTFNYIKQYYKNYYPSLPLEEKDKIDKELNNLIKLLRSHDYDYDFF